MTCSQCNDTGINVPSTSTLRGGALEVEHHPELAKTCPCCKGTGERSHVWPFSSGSECAWWKDINCYACLKGYDEDAQDWRCDIEEALDQAYMGDGMVTLSIAQRMGNELRQPRCLEFVEQPTSPGLAR